MFVSETIIEINCLLTTYLTGTISQEQPRVWDREVLLQSTESLTRLWVILVSTAHYTNFLLSTSPAVCS